MTISFPALPNFLSSMIVLTPSFASSKVLQIRTPFPEPDRRLSARSGILQSRDISLPLLDRRMSRMPPSGYGIFHQVFGERFRSFQDCRILSWSEYTQSLCLKGIYHAANQRIVHTDDGQVNLFSFAKATSLSNSIAAISTHSAYSAIPAFPGAQ